MILERIVFISSIIILMCLLGYKLIKKYHPQNILVMCILATCLGIYLPFVIKGYYIPSILQFLIFSFGIIIPLVYTIIQYNDIKLLRKILYKNVKKCINTKTIQRRLNY